MSVCYDLEIRLLLDLNEFSPNTWNLHKSINLVCIILHVGLHANPAGPHRQNDVVPTSMHRLAKHRLLLFFLCSYSACKEEHHHMV